MGNDSTVWVGLDVHKESITIAYAIDAGEVESMGKIGTTPTEIDRLCKRRKHSTCTVADFVDAREDRLLANRIDV
jgi:hypothetical protein